MPPAADSTAWHGLPVAALVGDLGSDLDAGLSAGEAAARLQRYGPNRIAARPGHGPLLRLLLQFHQPLIYVLLVSAAVTALLGQWVDAGVIFGVTLVNAVIGFIQEGRAESALAALARAVASAATVLRGGEKLRLDAAALVPGDVVLLAAGDRVPADLRLIRAKELRADESALTGESAAVDKHAEALPADTLLADRANMAYAGTTLVGGQGAGIVVATAAATETGRISTLIAAAPALSTPLTRKLAAFSNQLLVAIVALAVATALIGLGRGETPFDMFMAAVALAVGAIPEGLPAAVTVTLAIGVARMARKRAIIRKLPAVETLGSTTVICSDKTGTLTENQMTVCEIRAGGEVFTVEGAGYAPSGGIRLGTAEARIAGALEQCLLAGALCNDAGLAQRSRHWEIAGDPTEAALLVAARKAGLDERTLQREWPREDEIPFDSARQIMATLHRDALGRRWVFVKGAVERLLPRCAAAVAGDGARGELDAAAVEQGAADMAARGLRVLALARCALADGEALTPERLERGLDFLGLQGMIDPPRPSAIAAIRSCHAAGIAVKMISGDHAATALAIARQLGIAAAGAGVLTGRELAALDDAALDRAVGQVSVFARVEPAQKLRLVRALQALGHIVAMTGDGVNDAPALKSADIGVAMGRSGTEVAREAAAMVLTDDNFAGIEAAVEEGRGVYDNLVKFVTWTLPTNFGEGLVIVAAIVSGSVLPITPLQILWINMTTAVLLGLTLAFEPVEAGVMRRPPRSPRAPLLDAVLLWRIVLVGLLLLGGAFGLFEHALSSGRTTAEARTVAVNVFIVVEAFYLFNCRSLARSCFAVGFFSNRWLWGGVLSMAALQLAFTYAPTMHRLFASAPIGLADWGDILLVGAAAALVVGLEKRIRRGLRLR